MARGRLTVENAGRQNHSVKVIPNNCLPEIRTPSGSAACLIPAARAWDPEQPLAWPPPRLQSRRLLVQSWSRGLGRFGTGQAAKGRAAGKQDPCYLLEKKAERLPQELPVPHPFIRAFSTNALALPST